MMRMRHKNVLLFIYWY